MTGVIENVHTTVMKFAEIGFDLASKQGQSQVVNPGRNQVQVANVKAILRSM